MPSPKVQSKVTTADEDEHAALPAQLVDASEKSGVFIAGNDGENMKACGRALGGRPR